MVTGPRVVIIDQDPDARFQVQQLVSQAGFTVAGHTGVGTEAVALVAQTAPDIVLCGFREPAARVVQTMESIAHALPEVPLIAYAGDGALDTVRRAMAAGARDFLQTPLKPDVLKRSLAAALEAGERRRLRSAGRSLLPEGAIITIFGAKGGVGKTTLAANLAVAIVRRAGQTAVLVDADDTFGDVAAVLALTPERAVTEGLRMLDSLDGDGVSKILTHHESGLAVAAAPLSPFEWRGASGDRLQQLLRRLARQFDAVVVDTSGTLSDVTQAALESASLVLWLTTPEYASVRDSVQALHAIRSLRLQDDRIRVVLNVTSPEMEVHPSSIEEALEREIFWTIPYDRLVRRSGALGAALVETHPGSAAGAQLNNLALALSGMPPNSHRGRARRRFVITRPLGLLRRQRAEAKP